MLEDRSYMRRESPGFRWSATIVLLVLNVVCFFLWEINRVYVGSRIAYYLPLSTEGLAHWRVYQLITFQFLHGGLMHLLGNSICLFFFGRAVERALGWRSFVTLYLLGGVMGGLLQGGLGAVFPAVFGGRTVGASAGVFGVVAAFAWLNPEEPVTLLAYFIPITMRAKFLLLLELVITVMGILFPSGMGGIAHAAHLGGLLTGLAYVRWIVQSDIALRSWRLWRAARRSAGFQTRSGRRAAEMVRVGGAKHWQRPGNGQEELPAGEFISREVDPILDKISAHGIHSLTERERKILEAARAKMRKR